MCAIAVLIKFRARLPRRAADNRPIPGRRAAAALADACPVSPLRPLLLPVTGGAGNGGGGTSGRDFLGAAVASRRVSAAVSAADWMSSASVSDAIWSYSDRVKGFSMSVPISLIQKTPTMNAVAGAVKSPS